MPGLPTKARLEGGPQSRNREFAGADPHTSNRRSRGHPTSPHVLVVTQPQSQSLAIVIASARNREKCAGQSANIHSCN
eukprot:15464624-Alexandrium_andersonii.AAC.1